MSNSNSNSSLSEKQTDTFAHPRDVLLAAQAKQHLIPVCDHYSGVEVRMKKSIELQAQLMAESNGVCVFDVTLDCEDGAPTGGEVDHAWMVAQLVAEAKQKSPNARIAARVHPVDHLAFFKDVEIIVGEAGASLSHVMLPKVESVRDVEIAANALNALGQKDLPLHVLIESPAAVHRAFEIAAHARVESLSFGLMDFVSAHAGAISSAAMSAKGQFTHPLVLRAKLDIAAAAHAHAKVPSHCVVTEFTDIEALQAVAQKASQELGFTRMWSIHPAQIRPILAAFSPAESEIEIASELIAKAQEADWAPIRFRGQLHDRASYRYFWQVLERAHQTGRKLPAHAQIYFE